MTVSARTRDQLGAAVNQHAALSPTGLMERLFAWLFEDLVYPQIWEDPVVDMQALALGPVDRVVCIASGGCNVMSYTSAEPQSILAVDLSPAHVALGRLKVAAARHLADHGQFYDFFGHADRPENVTRYDALIKPHLDAQTRGYWETRRRDARRIEMFARGFYREGVLGRFIGAAHELARLGRVDFAPLLAATSLAEQQAFFDTRVAPLFDLWLVKRLARQRAALFGLGIPPAQYDKLAADGGGDVLPVLRARLRKLICDFPIHENYFAWQAFHRGYAADAPRALPPYLTPEGYTALKAGAERIEIVNRSLTDVLADAAEASKDAYVFLDAQDWMTDAQLNALWRQVTRTASATARVIFRTGGAADILPGRVASAVLGLWSYDTEASARGLAADRSAIYGGFHVYRKRG